MKKGWQTKQLGELCRFIDYRGKTPEKTASGLRLITAKNVKMGYLQETPMEFVSPESYDSWMTRGIPKMGDVLFTTEAPLANVAQLNTDEKVVFAQRIIVLQTNANIVDSTFLKYLLLSDVAQDRIVEQGTGATVQGIKASLLRTIPIEFPPLPEQQRIVSILDEAFEGLATAKANAEKNLQNAHALFESHLQSVFTQRGDGWVEKPLAELCDSSRVITYGVIKLGDETADGVPCLRTSNVRWLRIETDGMKRIAPSLSSEYSRTILKGGEVLVNVRGTLGGVAVAAPEMAGWNVSREVAVVPVNSSRVNPAFLSYLIGSGTSQHWLGGVKKGAAYIGINIEDLRLFPVNAPKMEKQLEVVEHLDKLQEETQRLASLYQRKLAALAALKKSLLHQAFNGEL
jgi:type I restriction enzyme S subunit